MTHLNNSSSNSYKSKRRMLQKLEKQHLRDLKRTPPFEIIIKIISYLDNPKDIKNCMLLSREIRNSIFIKNQMMRHFEFNLDFMLDDWRHGIEFLQDRGKYIRKFRYGLFIGSKPLMRLVLNQMPYLEELRFEKKKPEVVVDKKTIKDDDESDIDDCTFDEDCGKVGSDQKCQVDDKIDLKRRISGENGNFDENNVGNGEFGKNGEFGENGEFSKKNEENSKIHKPDENDTSNISDSDTVINSDLDSEDDNDSDDVSYKESIHSSEDESSIAGDSVEEIEFHSDESSDEFTSDDEDVVSDKQPARLSKLKYLRINLEDLTEFVDNTKDVKALEKLSVTLSEFENEAVLINFINNQANLKELELIKHKKFKELNLPQIENPKFNIKLKKLKVKLDSRNYESLANFIRTQIDTLEELEISIGMYRNTRSFINIFQNAKKLTILTSREGLSKYFEDLNDFMLESVKYFDQKNYSMDLETVNAIFPNLETLKCFSTSSIGVTYQKMSTLELKIFDLRNSKLTLLPNLRNFAVTMDMKNVNEENWKEFAQNHQNIENLFIQGYEYEFRNGQSHEFKSLCILENLRLLPKLQNVTYKTVPNPRRISEFQSANENTELVKVNINIEKKVAKVSQHLVKNHKGTLLKLLNDFEEFKFYEIKVDEPRKFRIDPKLFLGVEEPAAKRQKSSEN